MVIGDLVVGVFMWCCFGCVVCFVVWGFVGFGDFCGGLYWLGVYSCVYCLFLGFVC